MEGYAPEFVDHDIKLAVHFSLDHDSVYSLRGCSRTGLLGSVRTDEFTMVLGHGAHWNAGSPLA